MPDLVLPIAHHGLLLAIPFFGPVFLIAAFLLFIQHRDRQAE